MVAAAYRLCAEYRGMCVCCCSTECATVAVDRSPGCSWWVCPAAQSLVWLLLLLGGAAATSRDDLNKVESKCHCHWIVTLIKAPSLSRKNIDDWVPACKYVCRPQYSANDWDERGGTKGEGKVKSLYCQETQLGVLEMTKGTLYTC